MPKLGDDDYERPEKTITDLLSSNDIKQRLEDYKQVDNIKNVHLGSHLRYFTKNKDGTIKFRLGGALLNNTGLPKYIILSNGSKSWSVQIKDTIFFVRISNSQIKQEYQEIINDKDEQIKHLIYQNKELMKTVTNYKKKFGNI